MAKTVEQRIGKQMQKLGVSPEHFLELQDEYNKGAFAASKPGDGKKVREYIEANHKDWVTITPEAKQPKLDKKTPNPFAAETLNVTEQMRIYRANPELAERLAKAAGTTIGQKNPRVKVGPGSVVL